MRLLLDTHALIWALDDPSKLSGPATTALQDPASELFLSAATVWELAIKIGQKKLTLSLPYRQWMEKAIADITPARKIQTQGRHVSAGRGNGVAVGG